MTREWQTCAATPQFSATVQWAITHADGRQCEPVAEPIVVVVPESVAVPD